MNLWMQYLGTIIIREAPPGRIDEGIAVERHARIELEDPDYVGDDEVGVEATVETGEDARFAVSIMIADDGEGIVFASRVRAADGAPASLADGHDDPFDPLVIAVVFRILREWMHGSAAALAAPDVA